MSTVRQRAAANIRRYMKDRPEMNHLLGREEASADDIEMAIDMSVELFNLCEPPSPSGFTVDSHPSFYLLVHGAVIELLRGAGIHYSRNRLSYNDQGISVTVNDKAPEYTTWIQGLVTEYYRMAVKLKGYLNLKSAFGGVPSEFASTDFWY